MTTSYLKCLNLDPLLESMFEEIENKLDSMSGDRSKMEEFLDTADEVYTEPKVEELRKRGFTDEQLEQQFGKGWMYLLGKYNLTDYT